MNHSSKSSAHRRRHGCFLFLEMLETRIQPGSVLSGTPDTVADLNLDRQERRQVKRLRASEETRRPRAEQAETETRQRTVVRQSRKDQAPEAPRPPAKPPLSPPPPPVSHDLQKLGVTGSPEQSSAPNSGAPMDTANTARRGDVLPDRAVARPTVLSLAQPGGVAFGPDADTAWASFFGGQGLDLLRPITVGPGGLYTGGFIADPDSPGVQHMLVAKVSFDGATLLNAVALDFPGATFGELKDIQTDSAGNIYGIGVSNFQGFLARTYFRLDADWQTIRWTVASSVPGEGNGILYDEQTATVFVTGVTDARSIGFPEQSLHVAAFSDVGNSLGPTNNFGYVYTYDGFDGATGNDLGIGPDGRLQVAGTFLKGPDIFAAQHEISADGQTGNGTYFDTPGFSSLNDVYVDGSGNSYAVGYLASDAASTRRELLLTKMNPGLAIEYAYAFGANDVDLHGWSLAVDAAGHAYVSGSLGLDGDFDALVAKFSADGAMMTDAVVTAGPADELALGVDYDPATGAVYTAGYTISSEFESTPGSFQPIFGGLMDGFVMRLRDFA
jgi:hypothetical protein